MPQPCNHTSVGMFAQKDGKTLLIERMKEPFGFALPAGHVDDGETFDQAAVRELKEEVGLIATAVELVAEGRKENPCRRDGGSWHHWKIYRVSVEGTLQRNPDETKRAGWYSKEQIEKLAERTKAYSKGKITKEEWERAPGLEPVMLEWLKES